MDINLSLHRYRLPETNKQKHDKIFVELIKKLTSGDDAKMKSSGLVKHFLLIWAAVLHQHTAIRSKCQHLNPPFPAAQESCDWLEQQSRLKTAGSEFLPGWNESNDFALKQVWIIQIIKATIFFLLTWSNVRTSYIVLLCWGIS